ncbi:hypothetical protein ANCCEY_12381 [Ancylostoma ceylanicum]|uniref:Uncharacterized protein n=1 Tax=Ancylostoma ceylanicum TaxID=53326 RepID=A0A0D6LLM2_9BILA|nr:hypothetical protein ANCCEY_12381 [Ancylostoma ceylanicum]
MKTLITFAVAFVMLFGNEMLLTSLYIASIIASLIMVLLDPVLDKISLRPLYITLSSSCFVAGTLCIKFGFTKLLRIEDDAHIFDILRSKFSNYATFHTRLYTCSAEFDFMPFEVCSFANFSTVIERSHSISNVFQVFYNAVQTFCYSVMALLIMRLKLFMTPHLCICSAILANNEVYVKSSRFQIVK